MLKVGRYTAALLLVATGSLLLLDQTTGSNHLALLLDWWPLLLIMLGVEYILFSLIYRKVDRPIKPDISGMLLSLLLSAAVIGVTQGDRLPTKWLEELDFNIDTLKLTYSSESGHRFDKPVVQFPMSEETNKLIIENPNGTVKLVAGAVQDIEVTAAVWVDKVDQAEAEKIAEQSTVSSSGVDTVRIQAMGQEYTGGFSNKRKPRMNLIVTIPADRPIDIELQLRNGSIEVEGITALEQVKVRTINGAVAIREVTGSVTVGTTNGTVAVTGIRGDVSVDTTNGAVNAAQIQGYLKVDTTNGEVTADGISGPIEVDTTNGRITITDPGAGVQADATNGAIKVTATAVAGDYNLKTMVSSITLQIPEDADIDVSGSSATGSVSTDLNLQVDGKKISGIIGEGSHQIKLETNGNIRVNKVD